VTGQAWADPPTSPSATAATPQDCPAGANAACDSNANGGADYNGGDYTRPINNIDTRLTQQNSSSPGSRKRQREFSERLQTKIDLPSGWRLGMYVQIPAVATWTTSASTPGEQFKDGIGNFIYQAALSHAIDDRWAYGFGARLVAASASDDVGNQRWQIMPGAGVRAMLPEISDGSYFSPVVRYAISFAGDPTARNIREFQIAPTLNVQLPDEWFVTLYPSNDVRINYGGYIRGETGRLFLPLDASVGRVFASKIVVSLEVSAPIVKDYPVYDFKSVLKISAKF
jgi:hypothetical protein